MHVTLVCPYDPTVGPEADEAGLVGGVERVFREVSRRVARRGHDVSLICSTNGTGGSYIEDDVHVTKARRAATLFRDPVAALARHIPESADLVQVAATYPFTTPSVLRRANQLRIPSVLDFHFEPTPPDAMGRMAAGLYRYVGTPAYRYARAVLLRSMAYGWRARSLDNVPRERWRIVPNGIDPDRFRTAGASRRDYILFVGRLVPYKGLRVLLHALAERDPGLPLVIAGDGPLRGELERLARVLGVDARFLGRVQDDDLPRLYRHARLTVLPSVNTQEAFGITLIESMACGTPVVASDLPGVADVARFGGRLAPPGDARALAAAIEAALRPGALPMGAALAERVHERYSWDAVTERLLSIYDDVVMGDVPTLGGP